MIWNSLGDFVAMGGYGAYVWGAFGVVLAAMAAEVLLLGQRWRSVREQVRRAAARAARRR